MLCNQQIIERIKYPYVTLVPITNEITLHNCKHFQVVKLEPSLAVRQVVHIRETPLNLTQCYRGI